MSKKIEKKNLNDKELKKVVGGESILTDQVPILNTPDNSDVNRMRPTKLEGELPADDSENHNTDGGGVRGIFI